MRVAILAIAAALAAPAVPAQQAQQSDQSGTVAQPRYEAGAEIGADVQAAPQDGASQDGAAENPRFVRAPAEGGFEVTPLAPPGGAGDTRSIGEPVGELDPLERGTGDDLLPERDAGVGVLHEQAGYGDPVFRTAPEDRTSLIRPNGTAVPIEPPATEPRAGVRLRELDKMTGQTETFELAVGDTRQVDRLKIRLEACRSPETNDTHGTIAFLKVWDIREPDAEAFSGWMFAQSPSLSALDHPRYDLWVISCTMPAVAESSVSE
ncbi:MAG TPA: DUF2155 domain-containing protein [Paracoccaceae bacterium]|nr:DUF2155 domain-containing protein [Paracoccaceae bacterium]